MKKYKDLSNKELLEQIKKKLSKESKNEVTCNYLYELKDKTKIITKLKNNEILLINDKNSIYTKCLIKCESNRSTCSRHINKDSPDITKLERLDKDTYLLKNEMKTKIKAM